MASDYTESLAPNDVVVHGHGRRVHGSGVAGLNSAGPGIPTVTADTIINSIVLLAVFCQLLSQTKPMREEGPDDTADV